MKFIKLGNDYIDLKKIITVNFNDENLEIVFICQGIDEELTLNYSSKNLYFNIKRYLIKQMIESSDLIC